MTTRHVLTLLAAALAVYGAGLFQVPAGSDELVHYSSVANTANPLSYFLGDWGRGNHPYRPLHWLVQWVSYRLFGVWSMPDQLLGVLMHTTVVALLLDLMLRVTPQKNDRLPMVLALIALISPYSLSAANWMPDRPTLFVAIFLLLAVRHLYMAGASPRLTTVAALSVLALMSKESGVIVPALVGAYGLFQSRPRFVVLGAAVIGGYFALRFALFGGSALAYAESGYRFGLWWYEDSSQFVGVDRYVMFADNVVKHVVAIVLPVIGEEGDLLTGRGLLVQAPWWLSTAALVMVAGRRWSRAQVAAVVVIALNALIHAAVFRFRMLYISHLALMMFLAASPTLADLPRRWLATALAAGLLLFSVFRVEQGVISNLRFSYEMLASEQFGYVGDDDPTDVDPAIVAAITRMYSHQRAVE